VIGIYGFEFAMYRSLSHLATLVVTKSELLDHVKASLGTGSETIQP
jgi:hypothetical protein